MLYVFVHFKMNSLLTPAVSSGSIAKVAAPAEATVGAFGVVEALPALSCQPVT